MTRPVRLAAVVVGLVVAACGVPQASYDVTSPNVTVGPERSCSELGLSAVRCTAIILRAARELGELRPGHAAVESRSLHAEGARNASAPPRTADLPAIVVFALADGTQIAIPIFCPRGGSTTDDACNPRIQ